MPAVVNNGCSNFKYMHIKVAYIILPCESINRSVTPELSPFFLGYFNFDNYKPIELVRYVFETPIQSDLYYNSHRNKTTPGNWKFINSADLQYTSRTK